MKSDRWGEAWAAHDAMTVAEAADFHERRAIGVTFPQGSSATSDHIYSLLNATLAVNYRLRILNGEGDQPVLATSSQAALRGYREKML